MKPTRYAGPPCKKCQGTLRYVRTQECVDCHRNYQRDWQRKRRDAAAAAILDDTAPLHRDEYLHAGGTTWGKEADVQKKQEYNRRMGQVADQLRDVAATPLDERAAKNARYISALAEDEQRYQNRRRARSLSLGMARETLFVRQFEELATRALKGKIVAGGYAKKRAPKATKRTNSLLLSDTHLGARLPGYENPEQFTEVEERRRLAWVILQTAEFKTQYRDTTALNLLLNGDVIEGLLKHNTADIRDGAPLAEQQVAFVKLMGEALAYLAAAYPTVAVWCEPGNHGRNKLTHEGRATSSKWDGFEWVLYRMLEIASSNLRNVTFHIPKAPAVVIPVFDKHMLLTHGDTELKLGPPLVKGMLYEQALHRMNSDKTYGAHVDLLAVGHFHQPTVLIFKSGIAVVNSALVPPNGHARAAGYETACGQWLWESVPGHIWGDNRLIRVGEAQDKDAALDALLHPVRF